MIRDETSRIIFVSKGAFQAVNAVNIGIFSLCAGNITVDREILLPNPVFRSGEVEHSRIPRQLFSFHFYNFIAGTISCICLYRVSIIFYIIYDQNQAVHIICDSHLVDPASLVLLSLPSKIHRNLVICRLCLQCDCIYLGSFCRTKHRSAGNSDRRCQRKKYRI